MSDPPDVLAARAEQRVGRVLGRKWRLDRLLGVGGMGAVYAATHRAGKRVAVKILHPELSSDREVRARFMREGYVANTVDHPGVVSILDDDVDAEDGTVFFVMELLEGQTVADRWVARGKVVEPREALWIADQVLDVLAAAHEKGIVHRDLKPENLFLTTHGVLKVLDFGIARLGDRAPSASIATRAGAPMGTPAFMAPEQARGRWQDVDARTDVWAVGATMFVLLTGRPVHQARTANEALLAAMTEPAPALREVAPAAPPEVADVIDRALAFERDVRWPGARAMQEAVREAERAAGVHPPASPRVGSAGEPDDDPTTRGRIPVVGSPSVAPTLLSGASPRPATMTWQKPPSGDPRAVALAPTELAPGAAAPAPAAAGPAPGDGAPRAGPADSSRGLAVVSTQELADAYVNRGVAKYNARDCLGAIEDFTAALDLVPDQALAHYDRALARQGMGDVDGARADYDRAVDLDAAYADAWFNRGALRAGLGDAAGARADLARAAGLYRAAGDAEAVAEIDRVLAALAK